MPITFILAEVMDKEFPIETVWCIYVPAALVGLALCYAHWSFVLVVLPVEVVLCLFQLDGRRVAWQTTME